MKILFSLLCLLLPAFIFAQNTGIGTLTPNFPLEVIGEVKGTSFTAETNFKLLANPGVGKVLTSDADGAGTWKSLNTMPGTIAATANFTSYIVNSPSIPSMQFIGTPATITLTANQRVMITGSAALGKTTAGSGVNVTFDVGYQLLPSGFITNAGGNGYLYLVPNIPEHSRTTYSVSGSFKPGAGTYLIGLIMVCNDVNYFDWNDYVNCTYMIINE